MRYRDLRFACDTELIVTHSGEPRRARLINVSRTGGRLAGLDPLPRDSLDPLPRDSVVTLIYLDHRVPARVVWSNPRHTGILFASPLPEPEMNALRRAGGGPGQWPASGPQRFRELT